jgi:hypothetical protein
MKTLLALAIGFVFVGAGSISAQTETGILYKKHTFELGPESFPQQVHLSMKDIQTMFIVQ